MTPKHNKPSRKNLQIRCPLDCVDCALRGYARIEPPSEKITGNDERLVAYFTCLTGANIGDSSMHLFPKEKRKQLLEMRKKTLKQFPISS